LLAMAFFLSNAFLKLGSKNEVLLISDINHFWVLTILYLFCGG
jgi:hypothetical protein